VDTIFVHEKVFVYKTISKINKNNIQFVAFDSITLKKIAEIKTFKINIVADTLFLKMMAKPFIKNVKKKDKKWFTIDNFGISIQSLFSQQSQLKSSGGGIVLFATKSIYKDKLFLNLEFLFSKIFSSTNIRSIDGYYITPDAVLYYEPKDVITQQLNLPLILSWKYKKIKPQIGIAYTQKQTKLDLFAYKNNTDLTTIQQTSYKITNNYIDFMYGVEYDITKKISVLLRSKKTMAKINDSRVLENLKPFEKLHFFPNQVIFGVIYNFKKR
jgi:hypothetical protein